MSFGDSEDYSKNKPLSEINIIPLVDVMLVLLILFIITAPLLTPHTIKIDVPKVASAPPVVGESTLIALAMDAKGRLFWNDKIINGQEFEKRLAIVAKKKPQPELHLRADKATQYQKLAEVMSAIQKAGMTRLGFVMEPL